MSHRSLPLCPVSAQITRLMCADEQRMTRAPLCLTLSTAQRWAKLKVSGKSLPLKSTTVVKNTLNKNNQLVRVRKGLILPENTGFVATNAAWRSHDILLKNQFCQLKQEAVVWNLYWILVSCFPPSPPSPDENLNSHTCNLNVTLELLSKHWYDTHWL